MKKNNNLKSNAYMSKEVKICQDFNVNRLFLFNSGYVLSIFDFHEDKYYKKYVESSKLPEDITDDSEEFKELERLIDINIEKYYKKYTDIEYKSEWDSPKAILKELLNDLSIAIKNNRELDTVDEEELEKIINKYKNKPKSSKFETFEELMYSIKIVRETNDKEVHKFYSEKLNRFHSKKDFLALITDSEIKYNVKRDEELYKQYEKLKKILNEKEDYLYFYNSYKDEFDDDIINCIDLIIERKNKLILISKFENDTELRNELIKFIDEKENSNGVILAIYAILKILNCPDERCLNYINGLIKKCSSPINEYTEQEVKEIINIFTNRFYVTADEYEAVIKANVDNLELLNKLLNYDIKKGISSIPTLLNYLEYVHRGEPKRKTQQARIELSKVLGEEMDVVRREKIGTTYILHSPTNSYIKIEHDKLIHLIERRIGRKYLIGDDDLNTAIKHLSKRIKPTFNFIKLNNCLIDMNTVEKVKTDKPVLCLLDLPYDYNPEAKSEVVDNFLWSSLNDTDNETTKKKIQGLYELLGYLLTSGNKEEILLFLVGKKGGGKSVMGQIITALVGGSQNTCDVKLNELGGNDTHATAPFIDAHLNLIQEQDKKPIKNTGAIKQASGNDYMQVNPKYKTPILLEPEEVPKTVVMCNNLPNLSQDTALIDRVITLQFKKSFRNTSEQIKDLGGLITNDKEAMEYIIYNSLQAYKPIAQGKKELTLREDEEIRIETINKNANPIQFYLEELVELDEDNDIFDLDYSIEDKDVSIPELKQLIKIQSDKDGVQVETGKDGLPESRNFKKILCEIFDIDEKDYFNSKTYRRSGKVIKYYNHLKFKEGVKNKLKEANNEKNTRIKEDITPIKENTTDMNKIQKQQPLNNNNNCIVKKANAKILINLYSTIYNRPPMTFKEINKQYPYSKDYNDEEEVLSLRKLFKKIVKKGIIKEIKDNNETKYNIDSNKLNNVYCNVKITDNNIKHLDIKTDVNIKSLEQYEIGDKLELPIPQAHLLLINNKCVLD